MAQAGQYLGEPSPHHCQETETHNGEQLSTKYYQVFLWQ